jgi:hypothetical protein
MAYRISFSLSSLPQQAAAYWQNAFPHILLQYRAYIQSPIKTDITDKFTINSII